VTCDGVLLTGRFTPESSLFLQSPMGVDPGSAVRRSIRTVGPSIRSICRRQRARGVETGGWAFREGRAIGATLAHDLAREPASGDLVRGVV